MDIDVACYVVRYCDEYLTKQERMALAHLVATMKAAHGRSDSAAQTETGKTKSHLRPPLTDDPEVLRLASEGYQPLVERAGARILAAHGSEIFLNRCPKCHALAKSPKARQCRRCFHDWHDASGDFKSV